MVNAPRLTVSPHAFPKEPGSDPVAGPVTWRVSDAPVAYEAAVAWMEARVAAIARGAAPECVWLLEHPPLYTAGTSARPEDLVAPGRFPVHATGRGGSTPITAPVSGSPT